MAWDQISDSPQGYLMSQDNAFMLGDGEVTQVSVNSGDIASFF
jgi:hypothetical protein